MDLKRGIDKAVAAVVAFIKEHAEQVDDNYDKIEQVATAEKYFLPASSLSFL